MQIQTRKLGRREVKRKKPGTPRAMFFKQGLIGVIIVLFITALLSGVYYGSRVESMTIRTVEITGGDTIDLSVLEQVVDEQLEGTYFALVPKRFAWSYPHEDILRSISENNRIKNVSIERTEQTLVVLLEEYQATALWCGEITSKDCMFLDGSGIAFAPAPYLQGTAFIRYSDLKRNPEIGVEAYSAEYIKRTNQFVKNAYDQLGLNIIHVELSAEDEITYYVSGGGLIKVSLQLSTQETLDNLASILNSEEFAHLEPGNFEYIDLRFGNKVFVHEGIEEDVEETATSSLEAETE